MAWDAAASFDDLPSALPGVIKKAVSDFRDKTKLQRGITLGDDYGKGKLVSGRGNARLELGRAQAKFINELLINELIVHTPALNFVWLPFL